MRRYDVPEPYEKLKELTRGKRVDAEGMYAFVESLRGSIPDEEVERLFQLTPSTYVGMAPELAKRIGHGSGGKKFDFTPPSGDASSDPFYNP